MCMAANQPLVCTYMCICICPCRRGDIFICVAVCISSGNHVTNASISGNDQIKVELLEFLET